MVGTQGTTLTSKQALTCQREQNPIGLRGDRFRPILQQFVRLKNKESTMATIFGTSGNDTLTGTAGNDSIYGQAGGDTLTGGLGNDTLQGGLGSDTYVFNLG